MKDKVRKLQARKEILNMIDETRENESTARGGGDASGKSITEIPKGGGDASGKDLSTNQKTQPSNEPQSREMQPKS
ncbi:MAG TPA: hypothetical protein VF088_14130 [Pyrinomonadaceae bacterium]